MLTDCDWAPPVFYSEKLVTARKQHRCCETGRLIETGDRYWRLSGKWDDETRTYKQCESAYHFARWLNRQMDGCVSFGGIQYAVSEWPPKSIIHRVWRDIKNGVREFKPWDTV